MTSMEINLRKIWKNVNGTVVKSYNYDDFGLTKEKGNVSFKNDVKYIGAVHDSSSNLYYMNARLYNPDTGRLLTQDTYRENPYGPLTQYLYSYGGNNPVNMTDPTGHFFGLVTAAIGAAVGAAVGAYHAYSSGKTGWDIAKEAVIGAAIGGAIGLGLGCVAACLVTGTALASTSAVITEASYLTLKNSVSIMYEYNNIKNKVYQGAKKVIGKGIDVVKTWTKVSKLTEKTKLQVQRKLYGHQMMVVY